MAVSKYLSGEQISKFGKAVLAGEQCEVGRWYTKMTKTNLSTTIVQVKTIAAPTLDIMSFTLSEDRQSVYNVFLTLYYSKSERRNTEMCVLLNRILSRLPGSYRVYADKKIEETLIRSKGQPVFTVGPGEAILLLRGWSTIKDGV